MAAPRCRQIERDYIVQAALDLIGERGPDRVGLSDVAKHLEMPRARIRVCFPTEDAFWRAVGREVESRNRANWEAILASNQSASGRLRSLLSVQAGLVMATPAIPATLFSCRWYAGSPAQREHLLRIRESFQEILAQLVREGQATGEFRASPDADKAGRQVVEAFQGLVATWWLTADRVDFIANVWERIEQILGSPTSGCRKEMPVASGGPRGPRRTVES